jgi:hypothetical protein
MCVPGWLSSGGFHVRPKLALDVTMDLSKPRAAVTALHANFHVNYSYLPKQTPWCLTTMLHRLGPLVRS